MVWSGGSSSICDRVGISLPMAIITWRILSVLVILLLEGWGREHHLALDVDARQDRRCRIGRLIRAWIEV